MRTYFSNRIYKNELDKNVYNIIKELLLNYSYVRNYAYSLICKEKMGKITFKNSDKEPFNSLYYRLENRFPNVNPYLRNSAMQDARAVYKSREELNKLNIEIIKDKLYKIDKKIQKTLNEKYKLQEIKDQLKHGNNPISKKGKKYKLLDDGKIIITYGFTKKKKIKNNKNNFNQIIYKDIYNFETQYLKVKQKQLKGRLGNLIFKKNKLQNKLNKLKDSSYVPNVIFGGKKLQKQSVNNKLKRKEWLRRRYSRFEVTGRCDSVVGNYVFSYQSDVETLTITIDKRKYIIPNVKFPYGEDKIKEYYNLKKADRLIKNNKGKLCKKPITYSIEDKGKYYIIKCSLESENNAIKNYSLSDGIIGIDTNLGFWSVSNVSQDGNLISSTNITYDWKGKTSNQVSNNIENAVKELVDIAIKEKKPICIEQLKIKGSKKLSDYNDNKTKNFMRNMFAYNKMTEALKSRANKMGIEVYEVQPQYTSLIGYVKYMPYYKLSVHNMASYVIGRRCLGMTEIIPTRFNQFTDWKEIYNFIK